MAATFFAIAVTIVILGWLWFYIVRPILEDFGIIREQESVKPYQLVMSNEEAPPLPDKQTDGADRPSVSEDNLEVPRLQLDRTKATVIELMVYNGWQVGEIRAVIKGDNGAIGAEVEAARKRLGIEAAEPRTPIAGRPTSAQFAPSSPYQPPPR